MTTKDEALQMALEALTCIDDGGYDRGHRCGQCDDYVDRNGHVRAAIRAALAQKDEQESAAIGEEWTPCMKLPIVVHCRKQREGETHVSTREGITPVRHDDLIMRGVAGEEYPIGRELFDKTYTLLGEPT